MGSVATPLWSRTVSCATLRARHLEGASRVLELSGEADIATLEMLRRELGLLTAQPRADGVVDVTSLAFCDVSSAHLIVSARRTVPVSVVGATRSVERVFDLLEALHEQELPREGSFGQSRGGVRIGLWL
jgi:anti-anti-sigma regulatory factor